MNSGINQYNFYIKLKINEVNFIFLYINNWILDNFKRNL